MPGFEISYTCVRIHGRGYHLPCETSIEGTFLLQAIEDVAM